MHEYFKKGFEKVALPSLSTTVKPGTSPNPLSGLPKPASMTSQMRSAGAAAKSAIKTPQSTSTFKPRNPLS